MLGEPSLVQLDNGLAGRFNLDTVIELGVAQLFCLYEQ